MIENSNISERLKLSLIDLDMLDDSGSGLKFVEEVNNDISLLSESPEEWFALENAKEDNAVGVYFRRFPNRPSIPQIYIYDYTTDYFDKEDEITLLHKKMWNKADVPMLFIFTPSDVVIINCYQEPQMKNERPVYSPLTTIKLASEVVEKLSQREKKKNEINLKAFSANLIDNGSFWETSLFNNKFKFSNSAYEKLLKGLKESLKYIVKKQYLPKTIAKKLFVISILVKYLEERKDEHGHSVFPQKGQVRRYKDKQGKWQKKKFENHFFEQFAEGAKDFTSLLKTPRKNNNKPSCLALFDYLASHFNGEIFHFSDEERAELLKINDAGYYHLGLFFEGKLDGLQLVLWSLYDFNDLPIELISNIYEEFLESNSEGVVYTPPYLVDLLLDETLPLIHTETNFKVLDPACGSGIFLVGAYKRLIYRWRIAHEGERPALNDLMGLLKKNIYGADINPEAVKLAIFSLNLALCDELSPLVIWEHLQFENLGKENLLSQDFFKLLSDEKLDTDFDLVIGNPPFKSSLTEYAKKIEAKSIENRPAIIEGKEQKIKVPDNQIALLFLEKSIELCKKTGTTCLIMPSGPLLYNNTSLNFRRVAILEKYYVPQIFDFTPLSRVLFGKKGDVATAAIFVKNEPAKEKGLTQITFRRTKPAKEKIYFEIDKYDFHYVPRKLALTDSLIWKANFLGGGRTHRILSRFHSYSTLLDFINSNNWIISEGFKQGKIDEIRILEHLNEKDNLTEGEQKIKLRFEKKYKKASYLTGKNCVPTQAFTEEGIIETPKHQIFQIKENYFLHPSKKEIFTAPVIAIKEQAGTLSIPIHFMPSQKDILAFKHEIVGISGSLKDLDTMQSVFQRIKNNRTYLFYLAGFSGRYLVNRSTAVLKGDLENLPYPKDESELELNEIEQILVDDFLNHFLPFRRNGENAPIAKNNATKSDLDDFAKVFCDILNSVYKNLHPYPYFETETYICYPFYFGQKPNIDFEDSERADEYISNLVEKKTGTNLKITRVIRIYEGNVIYLIKPKTLRFWLRSIAIRDADETFIDLRNQGY